MKNNINTYFFISHLILMSGFFISNQDIRETIFYSVDFNLAPYYFAFCMIAYVLGRLLYPYIISNTRVTNAPRLIYIDKKFYTLCYVACVIGVLVSVLYVSNVVSLDEYLTKLFSAESASYREGGNKKVMLGRREGGLSGAIKVFNILPISVYVVVLSVRRILPKFGYILTQNQASSLGKLAIVALICSILRTLLLLDRLAFMSIIVAHVFIMIENKRLFTIRNLISIAAIFLVLNFISAQRGYSSFWLTISNYSNSHLVNLELLMQSFDDYTLGTKSILNFWVNQIGGYLGMEINQPRYAFGENPAQNFISFVYMDFGYLGVIIYFLFAILIGYLDRRFRSSKSHIWKLIYLLLLFDFLSCFTVPAHTAGEFWYSLLFAIFISSKYITTQSLKYDNSK